MSFVDFIDSRNRKKPVDDWVRVTQRSGSSSQIENILAKARKATTRSWTDLVTGDAQFKKMFGLKALHQPVDEMFDQAADSLLNVILKVYLGSNDFSEIESCANDLSTLIEHLLRDPGNLLKPAELGIEKVPKAFQILDKVMSKNTSFTDTSTLKTTLRKLLGFLIKNINEQELTRLFQIKTEDSKDSPLLIHWLKNSFEREALIIDQDIFHVLLDLAIKYLPKELLAEIETIKSLIVDKRNKENDFDNDFFCDGDEKYEAWLDLKSDFVEGVLKKLDKLVTDSDK